MVKQSLLKRWVELWKAYDNFVGASSKKKRIRLYNKYIQEISRNPYHNERHVLFCFKELEEYKQSLLEKKLEEVKEKEKASRVESRKKSLKDLIFGFKVKTKNQTGELEIKLNKKDEEIIIKVGFAIFFHDFHYVPLAGDNEEISAEKAEEYLRGEMEECWVEDIKRIIISTKQSKKPKIYAEKLMHDVDYAILGKDEDVFFKYEMQIRKEAQSAGIDEKEYLEKRLKFINSLLQGDIFYLDFFKQKYEKQAKKNLTKLKKQLEKELKEISN